jgi:hypothetical protein
VPKKLVSNWSRACAWLVSSIMPNSPRPALLTSMSVRPKPLRRDPLGSTLLAVMRELATWASVHRVDVQALRQALISTPGWC